MLFENRYDRILQDLYIHSIECTTKENLMVLSTIFLAASNDHIFMVGAAQLAVFLHGYEAI